MPLDDHDDDDDKADRPVGMGLLVDPRARVFPHWRTLARLVVHPSLQGQGPARSCRTACTAPRARAWSSCA